MDFVVNCDLKCQLDLPKQLPIGVSISTRCLKAASFHNRGTLSLPCLDPATTAFYGLCRRFTRGGNMSIDERPARLVRWTGHSLAAVVAAILGACAGGNSPSVGNGRGMSCLDDSPHCVSERQTALRHMVTRTDRHWIREPATVQSYASGVRLFAFKTKKKELTCDELQIGKREADGAARTLRGPSGSGLTPAQISRGVILSEEVSRELAREHTRRCHRG